MNMVDPMTQGTVGTIATGVQLLQSLKSLLGPGDSTEVKATVSQLYDIILTAQSNAFQSDIEKRAMLDEIRDLKEQLRQAKAWEATKQRYQLYEPDTGVFVYVLKEDGSSPEPAHWICANCYENSKRSILQFEHSGAYKDTYECKNPDCKAAIYIKNRKRGNPTVNKKPKGWT